MSQAPILLMNKFAGIQLGVDETQMRNLGKERIVPSVRIELGSTTLFPALYIAGLRNYLDTHKEPRVTKELARQFGRTEYGMQLQGQARLQLWELFRTVDALFTWDVERLFGLTAAPEARILQRWNNRGAFNFANGKIPASQLSAACEWRDMDYC